MTNANSTGAGRARRPIGLLAAIGLATAIGVGGLATNSYAQADPYERWVLPAPSYDPSESGTQTIVLAGGCFWGVQAIFQHLNGVTSAVSGYSGGSAASANYGAVGTGTTGHAESVEIHYNPQVISTAEILQVFFSVAHNPTTLNYQGPDHGTQYRSHIYYTTNTQRDVAEAYIAQLEAADVYDGSIVTRLDRLDSFYPAEAYHQDYLYENPGSRYIQYWDVPKLLNAQQLFPQFWRDDPLLVAESDPSLVR